MKIMVYAGTYTAKSSQGIYSFSFEDGRLSSSQLFCEIKNPKYLTKKDNCLITVADFDYESGVALINAEGDIKSKIAFEKRTSCFITSEDDDIYTANYHTGVVTHLKLVQDELKFMNSIQIQDGAGCHQILVFHDRILVPCLFLDRVFIFDRSLKKIGSIHFNANTGPRHGVFSKDGKYLYLVSELSNELFVIETNEWNIIHQIPVLMSQEIHVRDTAAIRLSDDEKFIYVSKKNERRHLCD